MFFGDLEALDSTVAAVVSGASGEVLGQQMVQQAEWDKVALLWTQGCEIPWTQAHQGVMPVVRMPTYPFGLDSVSDTQSLDGEPADARASDDNATLTFIRNQAAQLLGVPTTALNDTNPLLEYGADSIIFAKLAASIQAEYRVELTARDMHTRESIAALSQCVDRKHAFQISCEKEQQPNETSCKPSCKQSQADVADFLAQDEKALALNLEFLERFKKGELSMKETDELLKGGV